MMRTLPNVVAMLALGIVLTLQTAVYAACVTDAECDNGDVCSVPDTCVLGNCQLGGGGDTNDDLVCDAELDPNTSFNLTKLTVRRNNLVRSDASAAKGAGDLFTAGSPGGAFTGTNGLSIRVKDTLSEAPPSGDGVDATVNFAPGDCIVKSAGTTSCRTANHQASAKLKPNKIVAGQYRFSFKLKGLGNLTGPFFGPVRFVVSHSGNKRVPDRITDCKLSNSGLRCREF